jgi:hypothetical protein
MGAAATNYASLAGNGKYSSGIVEYNMQINHLCSGDTVTSKFNSFLRSLFVNDDGSNEDFDSSTSVTYSQYLQSLQSRNSSYQVSCPLSDIILYVTFVVIVVHFFSFWLLKDLLYDMYSFNSCVDLNSFSSSVNTFCSHDVEKKTVSFLLLIFS